MPLSWTTDRTFEINKPTEFTEGYSVTKFKNITKSGQIGHDPNQQFPDMDFPLFRLAEANLTFAEATIRAGGDKQAALSAINQLRKRAKATEIYGNRSYFGILCLMRRPVSSILRRNAVRI